MKIKLTFLTFFVINLLHAQQKNEQYFQLNYENDYFTQTDLYYTQGVKMVLILNKLEKNPINKILVNPFIQSTNYYGLAIQRDGFTPKSLSYKGIYYGERPYAAATFFSAFKVSFNANQKFVSQLDLGAMGPMLGAESEQKYIHQKVGGAVPQGWQYQIANDLVLNYNVTYEKGILLKKPLQIIGTTEARVGTLYTDINFGLKARVGLMANYFTGLGMQNGKPKFQCYGFANIKSKLVGYNATLQGGFFNKSEYTLSPENINRIVNNATIGATLAYQNLGLTFAHSFINNEFNGGLYHSWGHCNITFAF